jgi:hypothetical protein
METLHENTDETNKITFDEILEKINYPVEDFRTWGMKWFYYDICSEFIKLDCYVPELLTNNVYPDALISGSKLMIEKIFNKLGLQMADDPVKCRSVLENIIYQNKNELQDIVNNLCMLCDNDKIDEAWSLLNESRINENFYDDYKKNLSTTISRIKYLYDNDKYDDAWNFIKDQSVIDQVYENSKDKLLEIIEYLQLHYDNNNFESAWYLIKNSSTLEKIQNEKKNNLKNIIDSLQTSYSNGDIRAAWSLLKQEQRYFFDITKKEKLKMVISNLQYKINKINYPIFCFWPCELPENCRISGIWYYLRQKNIKYINLVELAIKYVEFAIFLYTVGIHDHWIYWSY